jgi:zinc transporter
MAFHVTTYGSDKDGLVCAYLFAPGEAGGRPPAWLGEEDQQELRQAAEEFSTAVADSAALGERVKILQEELAALIGERSNRTLFVLTVVTVLALPFNVIGGLFGMNVGGIPFADSPAGFWLIVLLVGASTTAVALWAFGKLSARTGRCVRWWSG